MPRAQSRGSLSNASANAEPRRAPLTPLDSYQKRLLVFLSVASFFEGYDFFALTQLLPNLRAAMYLTEAHAGYLVGVINAGTVIAYLLVRAADRIGRRRVLNITILGYALFSLCSGLAPNVFAFAAFQVLARIFLIGEWAVSQVIAAEEYPADRRGMALGVITGFSSLGAIVCAGVVPLLLSSPFGWRTVYFVGVVPLLLLAYARRNLRETQRFADRAVAGAKEHRSVMEILSTPYRKRLLQLGLIWFLTYICTQNGVTFWKEFAMAERGFTDKQVGLAISVAAVVSMPMIFYTGRFMDLVGRRMGALVVFGAVSSGIFGAYTFHSYPALVISLIFGIFGATAVLPVLNAFSTELFPTEIRSDAFAWANNLLGRIGYVLSPFAIGIIAEQSGWSLAVRVTVIFPLLALGLIFWLMPETRLRELEETARV